MLISAAPSIQAMYRPLTSVRFFRRICLALFGDRHLSDEEQCEKYLLELCAEGIYWTHYRKCYDPSVVDFSALTDACAGRYLAAETEALRPKLIVVLGDGILDKVDALTRGYGAEVISKPFPTADNAEVLEDVRRKIAPYLKHVSSGFVGGGQKSTFIDASGGSSGLRTHLPFEQSALLRALGWQTEDVSNATIEGLWYRNLVVPNMQRCSKLVSIYSFAENQINVLLHEHFIATHRDPMEIDRSIRKALLDYVRERQPQHLGRTQTLLGHMESLRLLRNAVVHSGGFIANKLSRATIERLPGIYSLAGTVYISKKGEDSLKEFARDMAGLLYDMTP